MKNTSSDDDNPKKTQDLQENRYFPSLDLKSKILRNSPRSDDTANTYMLLYNNATLTVTRNPSGISALYKPRPSLNPAPSAGRMQLSIGVVSSRFLYDNSSDSA